MLFAPAEIGKKKIRICEYFMKNGSHLELCRRVAQVRLEFAGPRGRATFARRLGLSASTYAYYEASRVPPADVLVKIADLAGVDLRWLLTGEAAGEGAVPANHPVVRRALGLLKDRPGAVAPLSAFLDLLADALKFPAKEPRQSAADPAAKQTARRADPEQATAAWIPILGRTAAGIPHFWADGENADPVTRLSDVVHRYAQTRARDAAADSDAARPDEDNTVQIITLTGPDESDVAEYVAAPAIKGRYGDAFAARVDGESMSPYLRHGDLVVLSPGSPAADGAPAVVQLQRQIGVTCKLYRREGRTVHLIPINEQFAPQAFPAEQVVWALRVLARVRPNPASAS